jgi:hypothetical protein
VLATEGHGLLHEQRADAAAAVTAAHAQAAHFGGVVGRLLHTDHADHHLAVLRHPESTRAFIAEVAFLQVVDVGAGVVVAHQPLQDALAEKFAEIGVIAGAGEPDRHIRHVKIARTGDVIGGG